MPIVVYILVFFVVHCSQSNIHVICPPQSSYYQTIKLCSLGHGYRILVVILPKKLLSPSLTNYCSLLTTHFSLLIAHRSQDSTPPFNLKEPSKYRLPTLKLFVMGHGIGKDEMDYLSMYTSQTCTHHSHLYM